MAGEKDYKTVRLPPGMKRAPIKEKHREKYIREFDYDKAIEEDFEAHRAEYIEVIMHGVPVKVKVTTTK